MRKLWSFLIGVTVIWGELFAANPKALVTNLLDNTITVIDTVTLATLQTFDITPFGGNQPRGIAVSPDGSKFYVASSGSREVLVFNTSDFAFLGSVPTGPAPRSIALSPNGSLGVVTNSGNAPPENNTVTVFDALNIAFIANVPTNPPATSNPIFVVFAKDGTAFYVTTSGLNNSYAIAYQASPPFTRIGSDNTVPLAGGLAIKSDGRLFVLDSSSQNVYIYPPPFPSVPPGTSSVLGSNGLEIILSPDETKAFVTNNGSNNVSVFSTIAPYAALPGSPVLVGNSPVGIAITPDGSRVFVTNGGSNTVTVLSGDSPFTQIDELSVGSIPVGIAIFTQAPPPVPPPTGFTGQQIANRFLKQTDLINALTWDRVVDPNVFSLNLYRDGVLLAHIPASATQYHDHNRQSGVRYTYTIAGVDSEGNQGSLSNPVTIP